MLQFPSFLRLNNILSHVYAGFYLFVHLSMDTLAIYELCCYGHGVELFVIYIIYMYMYFLYNLKSKEYFINNVVCPHQKSYRALVACDDSII